MYFLIGLGLFSPWTHGKPGVAPLAHARLRYSRSETLSPTSLKCYCLKVRKVTPGSHALHHMVHPTFQHTFTHILGPLASFGGILVFWGSPPSKRLSVVPGWYST